MEDSMNPAYQLSNPGKRFRQSPAAISRIIKGIARWHRRRTTIRELQNLSDYCLTDIGLDRSQIVSMVEALIDGRSNFAVGRAGSKQALSSGYHATTTSRS
ncbi:DUF1127 domain-containing protein [Pelagibius sp. Alg239-R121]|uniref:DUF1127 domain-containing protein n=1 Tax=Pelagibius sp. Alg239-R121 TaxID=2993448 RepID=UPI003460902C